MLQLLLMEDWLVESEHQFSFRSWSVNWKWAVCSPDSGSAQVPVWIEGNEDNLFVSTPWKEPSDGRTYFFLLRFW